MILTNGKDYYTVTTETQIEALKACGFYEGDPPKSKKAKETDKEPETI